MVESVVTHQGNASWVHEMMENLITHWGNASWGDGESCYEMMENLVTHRGNASWMAKNLHSLTMMTRPTLGPPFWWVGTPWMCS